LGLELKGEISGAEDRSWDMSVASLNALVRSDPHRGKGARKRHGSDVL
jgi:hypothetical protein